MANAYRITTVARPADVSDLLVLQAFAGHALNPGHAYPGRDAVDGWDPLSMEGPHRSTWHLTGYRYVGSGAGRAVYVWRVTTGAGRHVEYVAAVVEEHTGSCVRVQAYDYQPASERTREAAEEKARETLAALVEAGHIVAAYPGGVCLTGFGGGPPAGRPRLPEPQPAPTPTPGGHAPMTSTQRPEATPDVLGPSGVYGFRVPPAVLPSDTPQTVQVVECTSDRWIGTPARYNAGDLVDLQPGHRLAIDAGAGWALTADDTAALAAYARGIVGAPSRRPAMTDAPRPVDVRAVLTAAGIAAGAVEVRHQHDGPAVLVRVRNARASSTARRVFAALSEMPDYRIELPPANGLYLVHLAEQEPADQGPADDVEPLQCSIFGHEPGDTPGACGACGAQLGDCADC